VEGDATWGAKVIAADDDLGDVGEALDGAKRRPR
jgi:hypothetical protein